MPSRALVTTREALRATAELRKFPTPLGLLSMTLTTPNCPAAGELPTMVENAVASVPGVGVVDVKVVWEPPWSPERMSDEARLVLNMW